MNSGRIRENPEHPFGGIFGVSDGAETQSPNLGTRDKQSLSMEFRGVSLSGKSENTTP
jgi:hypothetical protein